jgi:hypothetical protein
MRIVIALGFLAGIAAAQSNATPLTGAWRVVERTATGRGGTTTSNPQPGLLLFTKNYFSIVYDHANKPRPDLGPNSTDAERLAALRAVQVQSGTYEISGTTLIRHDIVAASPNDMHAGNTTTAIFKLEGNTLVITGISNVDGPIANPTTTKWKRLE